MKKTNILRTMGGILFIGLVFFAVVFGTYQIFFDKAEAALFSCSWGNCKSVGADCSDSLKCTCRGTSPLILCHVGGIEPIE
jgi:hypothetical protein